MSVHAAMTDIRHSEQNEIRITGPLRPVVQQVRTCCGYRWAGCGKGSAPPSHWLVLGSACPSVLQLISFCLCFKAANQCLALVLPGTHVCTHAHTPHMRTPPQTHIHSTHTHTHTLQELHPPKKKEKNQQREREREREREKKKERRGTCSCTTRNKRRAC